MSGTRLSVPLHLPTRVNTHTETAPYQPDVTRNHSNAESRVLVASSVCVYIYIIIHGDKRRLEIVVWVIWKCRAAYSEESLVALISSFSGSSSSRGPWDIGVQRTSVNIGGRVTKRFIDRYRCVVQYECGMVDRIVSLCGFRHWGMLLRRFAIVSYVVRQFFEVIP